MASIGDTDLSDLPVLIGFRPPEGDDKAVGREVEVLDIEADQLASTQCSRESQEKQCAVAKTSEGVGLSRDHRSEVGNDRGCLAILVRAVRALDASERFTDGNGTGIELVSGGTVGSCNGDQMASKGAGSESSSLGGQQTRPKQ